MNLVQKIKNDFSCSHIPDSYNVNFGFIPEENPLKNILQVIHDYLLQKDIICSGKISFKDKTLLVLENYHILVLENVFRTAIIVNVYNFDVRNHILLRIVINKFSGSINDLELFDGTKYDFNYLKSRL